MSQEPMEERIVGSFASLLSSAVAFNGDGLVEVLDTESSATIPRFLSSSVRDDTTVCTIPSLRLKHSKSMSLSEASSSIEEAATRNLALAVTLNRAEVENAPVILLTSLSDSFLCLVDSRLRSSLGVLMRKSQSQRDPTLTRVIVGLLASSSNPIVPSAVVTSFRVLPSSHRPATGECVLPMVMETVVDMNILGNLVTVNLVAPGTIQGSFCSQTHDALLTKVEVILDTKDFLKSMMNQARFVVRNAISVATDTASKILLPSSVLMPSDSYVNMELPTPVGSTSSLAAVLEAHSSGQESESNPALMPPPPRRAPSRKSAGSLRAARHEYPQTDTNNASWPAPAPVGVAADDSNDTGLSLLTAAAAGMKHPNAESANGPSHEMYKRQRTGGAFPRYFSQVQHNGSSVASV